MAKNGLIDVEVQVEVKLLVSKTVKAASLEEGLALAKVMKATDIFSVKGLSHIDDSIKVTGVFLG